MPSISLLYALASGFGITFLIIQLFLSIDDTEHGGDNSAEHVDDVNSYEDGNSLNHEHNVTVDELQTRGEEGKTPVLFKTFLFLLRTTRKLTYFSAGFGSMGLICTFNHVPVILGLIYSLIVGVISLFLTSIAFKLLKPNNKDSRVNPNELVGCYVEILSKVGYGNNNIGEIKISLDNQILNFYATSKEESILFNKGDFAIIYKIDKNGYAIIESENKKDNFDIKIQDTEREV